MQPLLDTYLPIQCRQDPCDPPLLWKRRHGNDEISDIRDIQVRNSRALRQNAQAGLRVWRQQNIEQVSGIHEFEV